MVAKVQISTTVGEDGSVRLLESQIEPAGIRAGDRVRIEIVKEAEPTSSVAVADPAAGDQPEVHDADALAALPFDEWLKRFRADFPIDPGVDVEALIRDAEEAAADEFWTRFNRHE